MECINEAGVYVHDVKRQLRQQKQTGRTKKGHQFAPLDKVVLAIPLIRICPGGLCRRDRILLYGAMQEAFESKTEIIVPVCLFDEEKLVEGLV